MSLGVDNVGYVGFGLRSLCGKESAPGMACQGRSDLDWRGRSEMRTGYTQDYLQSGMATMEFQSSS
jgi:hypothetical protein